MPRDPRRRTGAVSLFPKPREVQPVPWDPQALAEFTHFQPTDWLTSTIESTESKHVDQFDQHELSKYTHPSAMDPRESPKSLIIIGGRSTVGQSIYRDIRLLTQKREHGNSISSLMSLDHI